jgi:hypothetical protein
VSFALWGLAVESAGAAVTHAFLPEPTAKISEGVPAGAGVQSTGPLSQVGAMTGDSGHMWLAESVAYQENRSRVDEFDASTGAFLAPHQLNEEGGISSLHEGIAVGHLTGEEEVYVGAGTSGKYIVAVFGEAGKLQGAWDGAGTLNGSFSESGGERAGAISGVAVDGSANLETGGSVYVLTRGGHPAFNVVDVFKPTVGGQEPAKPIGELRGTCTTPGVCAGSEVVPFKSPQGVTVSGFNGDLLVADGNVDQCITGKDKCGVDVFEPVPGMPGVYSFLFKLSGTPNGAFTYVGPMAVNAANGNIYVAERSSNVVDEFSATGEYIGRLTGTPTGPSGQTRSFGKVLSVAVDSSVTGNVFVADFDEKTQLAQVDVFGPDLVVPDVVTEAASEVTSASARLNGEVNPDKEGEASCWFAWGTTKQIGQLAKCEPEKVVEGSSPVPVRAKLSGLEPDTTYYYRLQASDKNGTNPGEEWQDGQFTTPGPGLHDESVSNVSSTSATFGARVDPHGAPTSIYFQYGTSVEYGSQTPPVPGATLGSGEGDVGIVRHAQGLTPDTTYHYRVVAVSEVAGKAETFVAPDRVFTTQPAGSAFALPDARRWELVSPADKHGARLAPIGAALVQASSTGDAISYAATLPTESAALGYSELAQVLSSRGGGGWSSRDISLPHSGAVGVALNSDGEYRFFSEDLAAALVEPFGEFTSLSPEAFPPATERTPYVRHDATCATTPATCYTPVVTGAAAYADVPAGAKFGGKPSNVAGEAKFVSATADLAHVVLSSAVALAAPPNAGETVREALYEWSASSPPVEALRLVSILPDGKVASGAGALAAKLGYQNTLAKHAISDDGSRVIWSGAGAGGVEHLYLRDTTKGGRTIELDTVQGGSGGGGVSPAFQVASRDGSRVFFTDSQRLTADSGGVQGSANLYVCAIVEVAGELSCELSDLTPGLAGEGANVQGAVLGASEDGAWVYFVANGVLAEGAVKGGCLRFASPIGATCNLYVRHYDGASWEVAKLVAVLGGEDFPTWKGQTQTGLQDLTSRVSPNGRYLEFMSDRSLTGYDNRDAATGRPDEEVYLYDAGSGRVVCASCNPTGARPVGVEYAKLRNGLLGVQGIGLWSYGQGIAANVPGWTEFAPGESRYQSRYLSDAGRLFFDSSDALVPQDINNNEDVYQYEPTGIGGCAGSSSTFEQAAGGCVDLVSSGTAAGESAFVDASESGNDVFFLTGERLVSQDIDTALDLYDAHACSSVSLCVSAPAPAPPCTTADACRIAPSPQPSIFGSPASATFTGAGNVGGGPLAPTVKPKALTRAERLARALNGCRKDGHRARRVVCERRARERYAVKQTRHRKATTKAKG